ncbi:MAG: hypothetical protein D6679_12805 [Candidatus Hydrogenedentota bacterium]|nr:MAG: hypothetical protein D6679_12805 [Candidatus Hydrogenedentota bacterium]
MSGPFSFAYRLENSTTTGRVWEGFRLEKKMGNARGHCEPPIRARPERRWLRPIGKWGNGAQVLEPAKGGSASC